MCGEKLSYYPTQLQRPERELCTFYYRGQPDPKLDEEIVTPSPVPSLRAKLCGRKMNKKKQTFHSFMSAVVAQCVVYNQDGLLLKLSRID